LKLVERVRCCVQLVDSPFPDRTVSSLTGFSPFRRLMTGSMNRCCDPSMSVGLHRRNNQLAYLSASSMTYAARLLALRFVKPWFMLVATRCISSWAGALELLLGRPELELCDSHAVALSWRAFVMTFMCMKHGSRGPGPDETAAPPTEALPSRAADVT
jgi:hypothetical protein